MTGAKPISIYLASHFKLSGGMPQKTEEEIKQMSSILYLSVAGSICMLSFAISVRYMEYPGKEH